MTPKLRIFAAIGIALALGIPALFAAAWQSVGLLMFGLNFPGVLLAVPHVPPEGYPGQSAFHAVIMLVVQAIVWFMLLTVFAAIRRRITADAPPKA